MTPSEQAFKEWLDSKEYPYLYIEQSRDTFSHFFKDFSKRPDFLIIIRNFGIIAVDVKEKEINPALGYTDFILDEKEVKKFIIFEKITRLPVWFVFCKPEENYKTWYWIPLFKVLECPVKTSRESGEKFRAINVSDCIILQEDDKISRLIEKV